MNNKNMRLLVVAMGLLSAAFCSLVTADTFTISKIEVRGNTRTDIGTVLNYLPMKSGDLFDTEIDSGRAIRALYETGLFNDVGLLRSGDALIVELSERPVISTINIEGNSKIDDERLEESLRNEGIYRGRVFNRSVLETVQRELRRLYASTGNYSMRMETTVETLERNRVEINIDISEGKVATIRHINIVGNEAYSDRRLLDLIESGVESSNFFSSADEYSRIKLEGDLEILRTYYLDRGYLNFSIDSTQVSLSPDKRDIYITINLDEGDRYTISNITLAGEFVVPKSELEALLEVAPGDVFSRRKVIKSRTSISDRLGDDAYAFANINMSTDADEESKTVELTFYIDPGKRVYVRRISFAGHSGTNDNVFRREMRLIEGGRFSPKQLERSRVRLQRLSFIAAVDIQTPRVPGSDDQIDINVQLEEGASGSFTAGIGIGSNGVVFNLGITQNNILGTGNRLSFNIDNSRTTTQLSAEYGESYYTDDGIGRTLSAFVSETDASKVSSTVDFISDSWGFGLRYGVPLSEYSTFTSSVNFKNTEIRETAGTSSEISSFLAENGSDFNVLTLGVGYSYDNRNRTIFAETGTLQRISLTSAVPGSDLEYYKWTYRGEYYYPLTDTFVFSGRGRIDYGDGFGDQESLPFFERYYAGGVRSLRGFRQSSLGPVDSTGDAAGGDFRTIGTLEVIFPPGLDTETGQTRMSLFTDFGNVFRDFDSYDSDEFRATYGLAFVWLAPIGPLTFSYAKPYQSEPGDRLQSFQFTIGSSF